MNNMDKLVELLKDEAVVAQLKGQNLDDTLRILSENGLSLTEEELHNCYLLLCGDNTELSEDDLDGVAGGRSLKQWWRDVKQVARGMWDGFWGL